MAKFYVGQRVRIVGVTRHPEFLGRECRVVSLGWRVEGRSAIEVDVWPDVKPNFRFALPWQLEPILAPGLEACDEDFKRDLDRLLDRQGVAS